MIEDTTINTSRIPDTSFTYTPQISRFMQALEYNMKARAGINPAISSEDIAAQRNLEMEEDVTAATERTLTSIEHSNPETMKNIIDSYRAYGRLSRSNPTTAVIESFTDADIADKLKYDGVFRTNATNTNQDYPVYMTRGAIFESVLTDSLENDNPSLYSYVRRFGAPVGLSIAGNIVKGAAGMFVTHGATAAYDVARLGTSIKNVQKKYHEWRNRLLNDETLTYDMFLEESKKLFADLKKEVPEEYRYEVYRALQEGPDPFADLGNSFTGLATDIGLIKPVGGIGKTGFTAAKRAMKGVTSAASKSKNVQKLQYNEELAEKIQNFATNKVDEEVVEDVVNTKAAVNIPQEASPELQDTVKGIVKEQESDNNLLQNVNNDSYRYDLTVSQEDIAAHNVNTSGENRSQAAEEAFNKRQMINARRERAGQRGEIRLERPLLNYYIDHGKGVNNDPFTLEEAIKDMNLRQTHKADIPIFKGRDIETYIDNPHFEEEPDYVAFTSAASRQWQPDDEGVIRPYYAGYGKSGEKGAIEGSGVYASDVAGAEVSRNSYLPGTHQRIAERSSSGFTEDEIFKKKDFKSSADKINDDSLLNRVEKIFLHNLEGLGNDALKEFNLKEINTGVNKEYLSDLKKYLSEFDGQDLTVKLDNKIKNIIEAENNFYYEGASLEDLKDYAKQIATAETIKVLFNDGEDKISSWLHTFIGKNPYKYPEKYIFNGLTYEPEVFGSFRGPLSDKHKAAIDKFENWKKDIKQKALDKGYYPPHGYGKRVANTRWDREDWFQAVEIVSGKKGSAQKDWYRKELQKLGGFSATLHEHHDGALNIVTINDKDFSAITKMENNPYVVDDYIQIGGDNAHLIIEAGDGVGYFVRELHGIEGSKPMIVENYKVVDKGDWK